MLDELRKMFVENRLKDEAIHAFVLSEIERGVRRDGLWAKALSQSGFNENETKARYIRLRVQSVKDELLLMHNSTKTNSVPKDSDSRVSRSERPKNTDYSTARATYVNEEMETLSIEPETTKKYLCRNCGRYGQMVEKNGGLLSKKTKLSCPVCGNTGPIS